MTETRTTRMLQPQYSSGSDAFSRTDYNEGGAAVESRTAIDFGPTYSALPVADLLTGRFAPVDYTTDGYSLYRYSAGGAWQFMGGTLIPRFVRYRASEAQALTDNVFDVVHPSQGNPNILAKYNGDLRAGGLLKSWNANDATKGALVVGWDGAVTMATTGRAYVRTRADGELGLVLHPHGAGAGNMLVVRSSGGSDVLTVDATGRLTQRTFAAFGEAGLSATSMVAVAPTTAADAVTNGLLLYGQTSQPAKTMLQVLRDAADPVPLLGIGRDSLSLGRLPWVSPRTSGQLLLAGNGIQLRASGDPANAAWWTWRTSNPTSPATEADPLQDTIQMTASSAGFGMRMPLYLSQRNRQELPTMTVLRIGDFNANFAEYARVVPDGLGGETTQAAASWVSDGRLRTGAWFLTGGVGTTRDARQTVTHVSTKRFTPLGGAIYSGQLVTDGTSFTYTWPDMAVKSSGAVDLDITTIAEVMLTQTGAGADAQSYSIETLISINGGGYAVIAGSENVPVSTSAGNRAGGNSMYVNHRSIGITPGATFSLRTRMTVGNVNTLDFYIRMFDIKVTECILVPYVAA